MRKKGSDQCGGSIQSCIGAVKTRPPSAKYGAALLRHGLAGEKKSPSAWCSVTATTWARARQRLVKQQAAQAPGGRGHTRAVVRVGAVVVPGRHLDKQLRQSAAHGRSPG